MDRLTLTDPRSLHDTRRAGIRREHNIVHFDLRLANQASW